MEYLGLILITRVKVCPHTLDEKIKQEIIELHKKFFKLDSLSILKYLMKRDYLDLYYDKNQRLIGTIGVQWHHIDEVILLYFGNAVIETEYQKKGLFSKSILYALSKTIIKYPFKKKYSIGLTTSPNVYSYVTKLENYWPKPFEPTPQNIDEILISFLENNYPDNYQVTNQCTLVSPQKEIRLKCRQQIEVPKKFDSLWFSLVNPDFKRGSRLPCIAKIDIPNLTRIIKSVLKLNKWKPSFSIEGNKFYQVYRKDILYSLLLSISLYFGFLYD